MVRQRGPCGNDRRAYRRRDEGILLSSRQPSSAYGRSKPHPQHMVSKVKIGTVGSRFQVDCIATSVKAMPDEAEVVAVAAPTPGNQAGL
jgi:hypothetical protein